MKGNKWVHFGLGAATALLGYLATVDWATLVPTKAGVIVSLVGVAKMIITQVDA